MNLTVEPVGAGAGLKPSDRSHEAEKPRKKDFGVELAEAIVRIGRNAEERDPPTERKPADAEKAASRNPW